MVFSFKSKASKNQKTTDNTVTMYKINDHKPHPATESEKDRSTTVHQNHHVNTRLESHDPNTPSIRGAQHDDLSYNAHEMANEIDRPSITDNIKRNIEEAKDSISIAAETVMEKLEDLRPEEDPEGIPEPAPITDQNIDTSPTFCRKQS